MDPLTLLLAAGAYAGAEVAKRSADAVIGAAYSRVQAYLLNKLGRPAAVESLDPDTTRLAGLDVDSEVARFGRDVLARSPALRRAHLVRDVVRGARVLWVDDEPGNNTSECRLFTAFGAHVEQVRTTREAVVALARGRADLVLSDIGRDGAADAGLRMLAELPRGSPPVVFYVGHVDESKGTPRGAFGIADHPEPLLHLALDVLERVRV